MSEEEEDIEKFVILGEKFKTLNQYPELQMNDIHNIASEMHRRSNIYLEFLAGSFLQETGLKPSEAELVCEQSWDKQIVKWYFRKRSDYA